MRSKSTLKKSTKILIRALRFNRGGVGTLTSRSEYAKKWRERHKIKGVRRSDAKSLIRNHSERYG